MGFYDIDQDGDQDLIIGERDGGIDLFRNDRLLGIDEDNLENIKTESFSLFQNYSNPFNSSTKIQILIPNTEYVALRIYIVLGEEVTTLVSDYLVAGYYDLEFCTSDLPGMVYWYRLQAGDFVEIRKMLRFFKKVP